MLHEKYGKIMKISGLPGGKNMVLVFDPDEIEKVSFTLISILQSPRLNVCRRGLNVLICLGI
jgi:effector-binding domain-containing protein